jgi:hypothetical protein
MESRAPALDTPGADRMSFLLPTYLFAFALFLGMCLASLAGHRIGRARERKGRAAPEASGAILAAMFAMLGLLLGFTFAGTKARLETRLQLILQEVNAIGTAYLRLDLLPETERRALRQTFKSYVEARSAFYKHLGDPTATAADLTRAAGLQDEIWTGAVSAARSSPTPVVASVLLPALNEMIDVTTTRAAIARIHIPQVILGFLSLLALTCAWFSGYDSRARESLSLIHVIGLAAIVAVTICLILDIDHPAHGLISLDRANDLLDQLAASWR